MTRDKFYNHSSPSKVGNGMEVKEVVGRAGFCIKFDVLGISLRQYINTTEGVLQSLAPPQNKVKGSSQQRPSIGMRG
jgi:hypothetical protein